MDHMVFGAGGWFHWLTRALAVIAAMSLCPHPAAQTRPNAKDNATAQASPPPVTPPAVPNQPATTTSASYQFPTSSRSPSSSSSTIPLRGPATIWTFPHHPQIHGLVFSPDGKAAYV